METEYKYLEINLTSRTYHEGVFPEKLVKQYIGGKGLGTKILLDKVDPKCDPLGPGNKLVFVAGPVTGTSFPTGNRYGILYKSPLTGTFAESYSGGGVAQKMRATGYYAIIIGGASDERIYLHVSDSGVEFKDATHLWGMDTLQIYETLTRGSTRELDILTIGAAGENLVKIANVQNNKHHSAGRCGPGALMGSKNLKAIVFSGDKKPPINNTPEFKALVKKMLDKFRQMPLIYGKDGVYRKFGTPAIVDWANALGCFPTRYYSRGYSDHEDRIDGNALIKTILKRRTGCWNCPFGCGKLVEVTDGPYKCVVEGPEYETIANFGGLCDIGDIGAIAMLNEYCDRAGIDTISAGALCALAIEARRRGLVKDLESVEIDYNQPLQVLEFLKMIVEKRGIGADFAEGVKHVSEKYGLGDLAVHVKGLDFAGYDPRAFRGFALSYGVAPEGPTHLRSVYHGIEKDLPNRTSYENKAAPMIEQEDKMAIIDSLIVCKFTRAALDWDLMCEIYQVAFGEPIDVEGIRSIAAKMVTMSRVFNVRAGFTRKDDLLPDRFFKEKLPARNGIFHELDREKYEKMLDEYYSLRGWSPEGIPPGA